MRTSILLGTVLVIGAAFPVWAAPWDDCLDQPSAASRRECLSERLDSGALGRKNLRKLETLVASRPEIALEVLDVIGGPDRGLPASTEAALLDLEGQALHGLGRFEESARVLDAALALDDGTTRLTWVGPPGGGAGWSTRLDPGVHRLERAARSLIDAGKTEAARERLAQALTLGAGGWAAEVWGTLGDDEIPGRDEHPGLLHNQPWRESLPDHAIQLYGGKTFPLSEQRGKVVVLDFWASWCVPCVAALPHLQELYHAEKERGLEVVAINYLETPAAAIAFARELDIEIPIGLYDDVLDDVFDVKALPTLFIADRRGDLRGRWREYRPGLEKELAEAVHVLLDEEVEQRITLAEVSRGADLFETRWTRKAERNIEGITVLPADQGGKVVATLTRSLALFGADGDLDTDLVGPVETGAIVVSAAAGEADGGHVVTYRPAGSSVTWFDLEQRGYRSWKSPSPVFDVAPTPPVGESASPEGSILLGTLQGVMSATASGESIETVVESGAISGVVSIGEGEDARHVALEAGHRLLWLDPSFATIAEDAVPADAWRMIAAPELEGVGVAPAAVLDVAIGRFLPGHGTLVALALASGQLIVLDPDGGTTIFRAHWDGVTHLAAGDLDGDGIDELIVAAGRQIAVLQGRPAAEG